MTTVEGKMKIKVIMCPADGRKPYVTNIENSLKNMQEIVGGYIEVVPLPTRGCLAVMNEEGRILAMPENPSFPWAGHCGDIFICGQDGEEFANIPEEQKAVLMQAARERWQHVWEDKHGL